MVKKQVSMCKVGFCMGIVLSLNAIIVDQGEG
jgi:hypothetical protein